MSRWGLSRSALPATKRAALDDLQLQHAETLRVNSVAKVQHFNTDHAAKHVEVEDDSRLNLF